jgi:DNA-binding transcriptional MocR family regulator
LLLIVLIVTVNGDIVMVTILSEIITGMRDRKIGPKYQCIAAAIETAISEGRLQNGDQLPAQRELADALRVTLGTVSRGYAEARRRGLLQGEIGRGTYIRTSERGFDLHHLHNRTDWGDTGTIHFDLNFPVTEGDPDLAAALLTLGKNKSLQELLHYRPTAGLGRHRESACRWISHLGLRVKPENLFITTGVQHGLQTVLLSQMNPGDALAVEQLTFPGIINLAHQLNLRLVPIAMDSEGMKPEALEAAARQHAIRGVYLIPTHQNPTTVTMPEKRRIEIAETVRKLGLFILEDEVYACLETQPLPMLCDIAPERTFFVTSLSKALAPGLRIGYLAVPHDKRSDIEAAMAATIWMHPPLTAELAGLWIEDGTAIRVAEVKRQAAIRRATILIQNLPQAVLHYRPGGLHLWCTLSAPWRADMFAREAERQGVQLIPAASFSANPVPCQEAVRICIGPPASDAAVMEGAQILSRILGGGPARELPII